MARPKDTVPAGLARHRDELTPSEPYLSEEELDRRIAELRPDPSTLVSVVPEPSDRWTPGVREALSGILPFGEGEAYEDRLRGRWGGLPATGRGSNHYDRPGSNRPVRARR